MALILLFIFAVSVSGDLENFKGQCRLDPHPSVEYRCIVSGAIEGSRVCGASEPAGTIVSPQCRKPNYYSSVPLAFMKCFDGYWDYIARCTPECGRVTPDGKGLVVGGKRVKRGELPWHAGIFTKVTKPYMQICGGSLISNNVVLSAAHCFWGDLEKQQPASQFAVAVGKLYRPWDDQNDEAQKSDVKVIHLPPRYQGAGANFQDDIAVVIVARTFKFKPYIRPVCLSFEYHFEKQQLYTGNLGKVAGWGLTAANGKASPVLQVVDLPYVEVGTCINQSPPDFREYITSDKICAGTLQSNSALCKGDSGGGLAFPESIRGIERYYLRGVVSTAANSENACNTDTYTSFTSIMSHEHFIKQFWSESGQFRCQDGSFITAANYCDGSKECVDGSDETIWACAAKICSSYLFQCAYGACVDRGATCNGVVECADGSDEAEELCNKLGITPISVTVQTSVNETVNSKFGTNDFNVPRPVELSLTVQSDASLRNDYKNYYFKTDSWFKVHPVPADWETANLMCKHEGAELATPKNTEIIAIMNELIATAAPKHKMYFAGVRQTFGSQANTPLKGVPVEQLSNNWDVDNSTKLEQCLGYSSEGTVWDHSCNDHLPYICHKMLSFADVLTECGTVDRGYKLDARTGHCYKLHQQKNTWEQAQKICRAEGGHLAIVNSAAEADVLSDLLKSSSVNINFMAAGFREWGDEESWWTVQGQMLGEAGFNEWCRGCSSNGPHPKGKNSRKICGVFSRNKRVDAYWCDVPIHFICEKTTDSLTSKKDGDTCRSAGNVPCSSCHS